MYSFFLSLFIHYNGVPNIQTLKWADKNISGIKMIFVYVFCCKSLMCLFVSLHLLSVHFNVTWLSKKFIIVYSFTYFIASCF